MPRETWRVDGTVVRTGNTFYSRRLRKHKHCVILGVRNGIVTYQRLTGSNGMTSQHLTATRAEFETEFQGWGQSMNEIHAERMRIARIQQEISGVWHEAHVENFAHDLAKIGGVETVERFRALMHAQDEISAERGAEEYMEDHYCSDNSYY